MPKTAKPKGKLTAPAKTKAIAKPALAKSKTLSRSTSLKSDLPVKITKGILKRLSSFHEATCAR